MNALVIILAALGIIFLLIIIFVGTKVGKAKKAVRSAVTTIAGTINPDNSNNPNNSSVNIPPPTDFVPENVTVI